MGWIANQWRNGAKISRSIALWENFVFEIRRDEDVAILRLTELSRRTAEDIHAELQILAALHQQGQAVCRAVPFVSGDLVLPFRQEGCAINACVFERILGNQVQAGDILADRSLIRAWGALVGRFHRALAQCDLRRNARPHWTANPLIRERCADADDDCYHTILRECVQTLSTTGLECDFGIVHADLHGRNVLQARNGNLAIIDFDDCCYHWLAYDVAVSLIWLFRSGGDYELVRAELLEGYHTQWNLSHTALSLLDHLSFLRNALDYKLTIQRSQIRQVSGPLIYRASFIKETLKWQLQHVLQ